MCFISGFFYSKDGTASMKRLCGLLCTISLCGTLYKNGSDSTLIQAVTFLACSCLALTTIETVSGFFKPQNNNSNGSTQPEQTK